MKKILKIEDVERNIKTNQFATFDGKAKRCTTDIWPNINSSFHLQSGTKIFTIGSCFARNIEEWLVKLGYNIPTLKPTLKYTFPDKEQVGIKFNSIFNKYTPANIYQELKWVSSIYNRDNICIKSDCDDYKLEIDDNKILDTNLHIGLKTVNNKRFYERRKIIYDIFKNAFTSNHIIITLGFVEAWYDNIANKYVHIVPFMSKALLKYKNRFELHILDYEESLKYIEKTIDLILSINLNANFLITTSPVSLHRTFTTDDIITANCYSKSVLRAVCGKIAQEYDNVDYFPSYESVIYTKSDDVYWEDNLHISPEFVQKIVNRLNKFYIK